jgi:acetyl-CoA carboxylase biotin carboxyl carrier protein
VPERDLTYEDLLRILQLVESSSQFAEFHLKYGDIEIDLRKHSAAPGGQRPQERAPAAPAPAPAAPPAQPAAPPEKKAQVPAPAPVVPEGMVVVEAPMVGTFYRAPEPGAKPFVEVGQRVAPDTVVCIIEVMKLMNSIAARHAGVVTQILVNDGDPVEFGQPLIVIDRNA